MVTMKKVRLPTYIDSSLLRYYSLSESEQETANRILWELCEAYPQITYAPTLYPLIAIMLHKHDQDYTNQTICQLLQKNLQASRDRQFKRIYMPTTRLEHVRDVIVLIKLCTRFGFFAPLWMRDLVREEKRFLAILDKDSGINNSAIQSNSNNNNTSATTLVNYIDTPFFDWYRWIFVALPFSYCTRIIECWLVDGQKFLFRIALAMLSRYRKQCSSPVSLNSEKMFDFCSRLDSLLEAKGGVEQLIKEARSLKRISTLKIAKVSRKYEAKANLIVELLMRRDNETINIYNQGQKANYIKQPRDDMLNNIIISPRIAPRSFTSSIVNDLDLLDDLWQYIPERAAVKTVSVIFNSNNDGTSLQTFFSRVDPYEETIIIIRTIKNEVFGSYCSSSWSLRKNHFQSSSKKSYYFGNGETFLFTLQPKLHVYLWVGKTDHQAHDQPKLADIEDDETSNKLENNTPSNTNTTNLATRTPATTTNNMTTSTNYTSQQATATPSSPSKSLVNRMRHRESVSDMISTQLFMSATSQELIIGSGNGSFGLWLDADLTRGKTDHCKTFNNLPLCEDKDFTCKDVEVLGFA